jgi:hypothetical protein
VDERDQIQQSRVLIAASKALLSATAPDVEQPFTPGGLGIFRDGEDWVRVRYADGREIDMTRVNYIASKRSPPFETLPVMEAFAKSETGQSR